MQASDLTTSPTRNITSRVVSVIRTEGVSVLTARPPAGESFEVRLDAFPDQSGADRLTADGTRVLAVQFTRSAGGAKAHAFVTATGGARRVEVLPSIALALCERGVGATWVPPVA